MQLTGDEGAEMNERRASGFPGALCGGECAEKENRGRSVTPSAWRREGGGRKHTAGQARSGHGKEKGGEGRRAAVAQGHRPSSVAGAATFACSFAGSGSGWPMGDQPSWFPRRQAFPYPTWTVPGRPAQLNT